MLLTTNFNSREESVLLKSRKLFCERKARKRSDTLKKKAKKDVSEVDTQAGGS